MNRGVCCFRLTLFTNSTLAKKTRDWRKAFLPYKKHLQKKLGEGRKVFIAYPAILKYIDEEGRQKTVGEEDLKKLKGEMTKYT